LGLLVQKFGGTSVADSNKILAAARRAIQAHQRGDHVLVVVSARGHTTDELVELAREINERPPAREMDMLLSTGEQITVALMAMAVEALGVPAISFTGAQIGLVTDSFHTKARIRDISTERIQAALDQGRIVIVAGFQGVDENYNITTLGRGGSDTTAVALAAVLGATACEIYTDVDGVYTTDPRIVPEARKIDRVSYDEMLELASLGAGVMHSRSIEFAKKYGVPIHVRSSLSDAPGTWIVAEIDARRLGVPVNGAALAKEEARITIQGVPDRPGVVHRIFHSISKAAIVVDMIVQNVAVEGKAEISFTVAKADLPETLSAAEEAARAVGAAGVRHDANVSKVSVVGMGMRTHTGVATTMFEALAKEGVNIQMITTSEIKISVLIERPHAATALRAVHKAFMLDEIHAETPQPFRPSPTDMRPLKLVPLVSTSADADLPRGMEDLVIAGVDLDETQANVALFGVPDEPGYAAKVFRAIGEAGVLVDMIVQNVSLDGLTDLSFTVPRESADRAAEAVRPFGGTATVERELAKLTVAGVGMRTHTGVATAMFRALADASINIKLINTSEVRVNVGADSANGQLALACLRKAFALDEA
jgi:aspartate kinase